MARRILGLDLGSHAVKAVEFRQTLRGVEVAQIRTLPLDEPSASPGQRDSATSSRCTTFPPNTWW